VIRAEPKPLPEPIADLVVGDVDAPRTSRRNKRDARKAPERQAFAPPAFVPSWAKFSSRAGEDDTLFSAGASLALLDAFLRQDPPCAGALRQRLALQSAAASAKILRLRTDEQGLRDLRFALTEESDRAMKLLGLWRDLASRPPTLDARRLAKAASALDLALRDPEALAASLRDYGRGPDDPVSAAAKAAAAAFSAFPDSAAAEAETFALWTADLVLAIRLRWERPLPLIATKIGDPILRVPETGRRPKPDEPTWAKTAAAAIALAASSALDLGAELSRRAETLLTVAPRLRAKRAMTVVELLLAEDGISSGEIARKAPMTDRSARRLFDRLVALGAARELSGRPNFRLYGL
jgi:hypothetical protein